MPMTINASSTLDFSVVAGDKHHFLNRCSSNLR